MQNIGRFSPILLLSNVRRYDFPVESLGMAILLFILEMNFLGKKGMDIEEITAEFHEYVNHAFRKNYSFEQFNEIMKDIIQTNLMNRGEPHSYSYWDLETSEFVEKRFHLLVHTEIDVSERTSKIKLSPDAIEMLFQTKEILGELKVSISHLYLRQQIERGVWDDASRTVKELRSLVNEEAESIIRFAEKIQKDVLLVNQEIELRKQFGKINEQIRRERKTFNELQELIQTIKNDYQDKLNYSEITEKEKKVFEKMASLQRELYDVDSEHESLLSGKLGLQQLMNKNLDSLIINMFSTKLNFETEILLPLIKQVPLLDTMRTIINPFFAVQVHKSFHPAKIFEYQSLRNRLVEMPQELIIVTPEMIREVEEQERLVQEQQVLKLQAYLTLLIEPLVTHEEVHVEEIADDSIIDHTFFDLLIELHQMGTIELRRSSELMGIVLEPLPRALTRVVDGNDAIYNLGAIEVFSNDDQAISLPSIRKMSNFYLRRSQASDTDL